MNAHAAIAEDPRRALIEALSRIPAGMLGAEGAGLPMQPMTHRADWEQNSLWFVTMRNSALVQGLGPGAPAQYVVMSDALGFDACLRGFLSEDGTAAEPDVTRLRLDLREAAVWGVKGHPLPLATAGGDGSPALVHF